MHVTSAIVNDKTSFLLADRSLISDLNKTNSTHIKFAESEETIN